MIQGSVINYLHYRVDRARFRVIGSVYQPLDARMNHRAGTHRARLDCNKQFAITKPVVTEVFTRFA